VLSLLLLLPLLTALRQLPEPLVHLWRYRQRAVLLT
jgi:hypothetical protein